MDWDFKNPLKVLYGIYKCLKYLNNKEGEQLIIKMSQRKGYHIFLWTKSYGDKFKIREELLDDWRHLAMDKKHAYGRQTLFHKKKKFKKLGRKGVKK